ncbi:MAG TPA: hypothetical protein EYH52_16600 [Acinetobacter venetianus]|uniref:hypothetical protein n=1 Tax=Acinetobacter venetianus TaxID=52133 RepID=UPI001A10E12C|nr:hypothetical protein [Acinetobacter venetianus]HIQ36215.1 hypothetical protein [Acinetobacter venetianus]
MALEVNIQTNKDVSLWREYKDAEGNILAEFKVRGIGFKPYQVALERANNQITSKGFDVKNASKEDKLYHELVLEAAACHLIEDWKGVVFVEKDENGESIRTEPGYDSENAVKLLGMGDVGVSIWLFIKSEAEKIQLEADTYKVEVVGKSQPCTSGQSSAQKKKRTTTAKSKTQSQMP